MKSPPNTLRQNLYLGLAYIGGIALLTALAQWMH